MVNAGNTAWVLASAALVMLMTPGLAFFYGGMVRSKNVLNMLMMNFICLAVVGVLWALFGYSWAFGDDVFGGLIGGNEFAGLGSTIGHLVGYESTDPATGAVTPWPGGDALPTTAFVMFQLMFAVITPALVSGAIADRTKFWAWTAFVAGWVTLCYFPVAHWVFSFDGFTGPDNTGGWIANVLKAEDFAGGTAVHINAGAAALALAIVLGRRKGWPRERMRPHNLPFVLLGASLLWFGWYGFNAGSALAAGDLAGLAFTNTTLATGTAVLGWLLVEQLRDGKPTTLGAASGAVAGLVAITPACGFVSPLGALAIGVIAGAVCALAVGLKYRFGFDDSLDVVGVHLVGGLVGTLLIGFFGTNSVNPAAPGENGLFYGGGLTQLGRQALAAGAVMLYSFLIALILGYLIKATIGFRVSDDAEVIGVDETEHAETGYDYSGLGGVGGLGSTRPRLASSEGPARATAGKEN
ncbi:ammonium transporter [Pseudonocardia asaccharolytica]|uniref:Ammonium transporter n=1 Tax=Pseudonocardia asaccharolytica DSM 44247 = NBRC 16224 TaxID=1123024 RepID=A0A511D2G0_9PSEU|nr:ammonium transporter [Pseudonocardia asaccharolytica]GEL17754.1 ammonium transporter [Pseudonocardia asaccharolytica DSM 44247 = NBRC 16224]